MKGRGFLAEFSRGANSALHLDLEDATLQDPAGDPDMNLVRNLMFGSPMPADRAQAANTGVIAHPSSVGSQGTGMIASSAESRALENNQFKPMELQPTSGGVTGFTATLAFKQELPCTPTGTSVGLPSS